MSRSARGHDSVTSPLHFAKVCIVSPVELYLIQLFLFCFMCMLGLGPRCSLPLQSRTLCFTGALRPMVVITVVWYSGVP